MMVCRGREYQIKKVNNPKKQTAHRKKKDNLQLTNNKNKPGTTKKRTNLFLFRQKHKRNAHCKTSYKQSYPHNL